MHLRLLIIVLPIAFLVSPAAVNGQDATSETKPKTLKVLFVGNSYTARHNLANVVESMAEEAYPDLDFQPTTVIYGGRTLRDHWELGTQNIVAIHDLTLEKERKTIAGLRELIQEQPKNKYAPQALKRHEQLAKQIEEQRTKWDVIILQSYRDDLSGDKSPYVQFAPKYAQLAKKQGARVILYETTPTTQNAQPLQSPPETDSVMQKATSIARLATKIDARVAPMSLVGLRCQQQRPGLTLRFVNDGHLNQTMAYLTACTVFSALFDRTAEGLQIDSITDIRYWQNKDKTRDRDNKPITQTFSEKDRLDLQQISWKAYQEFKKLPQ